jgi:hypothetical protein
LAASKTGGSNGQAASSKPQMQVHRHEHQQHQPAGFGM